MSVKGKIPYVSYVASTMTEEEIDAFRYELNSSPTLTEIGYSDLTENIVDSVSFKFSNTDYKNGIIVKNDDVCVLFVFYDEEKISIYDIDLTNSTYKEIKEYCTIFELRTVFGAVSGTGGVTPSVLLENMEGSDDIVVDLNETNDKVQFRLDQDAKELIEYTNVAISDISHEIIGGNTIITVTDENLDSTKAYEFTLEIEGDGVHYGTKLLTLPYNNSQCFTASYLYTAETDDVKVLATMDNSGQVNITLLDYEMTPESQDTMIHYKKLW